MTFSETLRSHGIHQLRPIRITTLQVNVGKTCNQACHHCHVDAGPSRTETMSQETADLVIGLLQRHPQLETLDITGGAPEIHAVFRRLVRAGRSLGRSVIDRCNLTVLLEEPQKDLAEFLAEHKVVISASLPCYLEENVDRQRGSGAYAKSIAALKLLNSLGYGKDGGGLELNLVYNPIGPSLPPAQAALEADYKAQLFKRHGIVFNHLLTITNMPISRFRDDLLRRGALDTYMQKLASAFNPEAAQGVMCRSLISVGWDGTLYDCDFNQMLELGLTDAELGHISKFDLAQLEARAIQTGDHCLGCTAGAGSSCSGALIAPSR
jgi:radical SAM/Cys-rich protein